MTTLRVLLGAPPDPAIAVPWALFDAAGRLQASGIDTPGNWPAADAREAILTCDAVRIVALELPPMPATRRAAAVGFAIEDQLAGPVEMQAIAVGEPEADGVTLARITTRTLVSTLARAEPAFSRIVAEPDLAESSPGWRWCARENDGFVRRADGSAFAVGPRAADGDIPSELAIALAQAARTGDVPATIEVDAPCDPEQCAQWVQRYGVSFHRRSPWHWERSSRFAHAPDLRLALAATPRSTLHAPRITRLFRPAIALVLFAALLHVLAATGTWIVRRIELARVNRDLSDVAVQAGLRDVGPNDAAAAIGRAFSQARHVTGMTSPGDAIPLLARIAGPMAVLPDAVLKSATYSGATWTLELAPVDDTLVSRLVRQLAADDLAVVHARMPAGVRMRVGPVR